ncbi:MAG: MoaD/ThiS family protein [Bacteroidetes Order II. Incertae sedis bacterium]|jgi:molybdopterin converting factor subunit 1|nr:MoaD/ThiS family protein [Bacteroidetes Order II. bacterium]MDG1754907.1 MoaD/ThiS family protein [Rhodothermales bacterium]MBT4602491.1 MoaD/ThiS family protein [Bacteroidetes Order II. bacterium]MBT5250578.1 MoaD/ThiS family protein [Bacteroidetes Order II. bacterium]MBT6201256.1 MoaD/ThiS family protein [Bacteroidetes Order II. bacterium]
MIVTLRFFSVLREAFGAGVVEVELEAGTTGAELIELLAVNNEEVEKLQSVIRLAVNDDYIDPTSLLSDGDDIAVITPVSGG